MPHPTRQKIAALYARTSSDADDDYSLSSQLAAMRTYAERHGFYVAHEFKEEFTGTKLDRPELNKARALLIQQAIEVLVIYRADRLARMQYVAGYLLHEEIFPNDVELHVVSFGGRIRPGTRDVLIFNIESAISQDERDTIVERMQRGKRNKLAGGDGIAPAWIGYGAIDKYSYEKRGKRRTTHMVIVQEEAVVVLLIFHLYADGMGVAAIARHLDEQGIPPPSHVKGYTHRRARRWQTSTILCMLNDTAYIGVWYANRHQEVQGSTYRRRDEECVRLDFPHLRIVDDETFARVQERLEANRIKYAKTGKYRYLLSCRIRCSCGSSVQTLSAISPVARIQRGYYFCWRKVQTQKASCQLPNIRTDIIDGEVWNCLKQLLTNPQGQLAGIRRLQEAQQQENYEAVNRLEQAQKAIEECQRLLSRYADQEAEGLISRQMLRAKKAQLDPRLEAARCVQEEYAALIAGSVLSDEYLARSGQLMERLNARLTQLGMLSFEEQRELVEALNITGLMALESEDGTAVHVLYLYLHSLKLARIVLRDKANP